MLVEDSSAIVDGVELRASLWSIADEDTDTGRRIKPARGAVVGWSSQRDVARCRVDDRDSWCARQRRASLAEAHVVERCALERSELDVPRIVAETTPRNCDVRSFAG